MYDGVPQDGYWLPYLIFQTATWIVPLLLTVPAWIAARVKDRLAIRRILRGN